MSLWSSLLTSVCWEDSTHFFKVQLESHYLQETLITWMSLISLSPPALQHFISTFVVALAQMAWYLLIICMLSLFMFMNIMSWGQTLSYFIPHLHPVAPTSSQNRCSLNCCFTWVRVGGQLLILALPTFGFSGQRRDLRAVFISRAYSRRAGQSRN